MSVAPAGAVDASSIAWKPFVVSAIVRVSLDVGSRVSVVVSSRPDFLSCGRLSNPSGPYLNVQ